MAGLFSEHELRRIINGAGPLTTLGAAAASDAAIATAGDMAGKYVEMHQLQRLASDQIARTCGSEAGCVTACVAAGLCVAVAATMTGDDLAAIEKLPETGDLKNQVVLQKGHNCHFSGGIGQMLGLSGAELVEIGASNRATEYQLAGAIGAKTAAAVYVVSHQTAPMGMIGLEEFIAICHDRGVPVIVDASAEYDLEKFSQIGADLVLYSAHKFLGGLTAGIIAGRKSLVRACYLQEQGIGRAMKVGKEGVASAIAVLRLFDKTDFETSWRQRAARTAMAVSRLGGIEGVTASAEPDPTGNPLVRARLKLDPTLSGMDGHDLRRVLAWGNPAIYLRAHDSDPASILIDPSTLDDGQMLEVLDAVEQVLADGGMAGAAPPHAPPNENLECWPDRPPGPDNQGPGAAGGVIQKAPGHRANPAGERVQ